MGVLPSGGWRQYLLSGSRRHLLLGVFSKFLGACPLFGGSVVRGSTVLS